MKKVGNYTLVSELGKGQFGIVYKAIEKDTQDVFAVKVVPKEKLEGNKKLCDLFNTEMEIMSKICHPNVMRLFEYMETANNYYLVITFCNSGDLEAHLEKHKNLAENEAVYFLKQIMNGFKELHSHKIMHRDFKSANVFLHDDTLVIGDFGFAKAGTDIAQTKLGSPITMAPELLNSEAGKASYTNKLDLWSIGICFYEMLFGDVPWDTTSLTELKKMVI